MTAASWSEANAAGLAHAGANEWTAARVSFQFAADRLEQQETPSVSTHEAMALVLGNLASACFRSGAHDDAIRHAQRGCALRVALVGEDAVAVARARSDLAVMLAAAGRIEEAPALLARAIAGIEQSAGDEDARLAIVLENAARMALASGQPANAEPHLIRLHALLAANDMPTATADALVDRVMSARARAAHVTPHAASPAIGTPHATPAASPIVPQASDIALEPTASAAADEWEDQPLRDAVVLTDALLRTTPSGNVAIRPSADATDPWTRTPASSEAVASKDQSPTEPSIFADGDLALIDFGEMADAPSSDAPLADAPLHDANGGVSADALTEPFAPTAGDVSAPGGLGFVVEYGVPRDTGSQRMIPDRTYEPPAIRSSDSIAREAQDQAAFDPDGDQNVDVLTPPGAVPSLELDTELELVPDAAEIANAAALPNVADVASPALDLTPALDAATASDAAPPFVERRKTPRAVSVVMPSPAGGAPVVQSTMSHDGPPDSPIRGERSAARDVHATSAARPTVHSMDAVGANANANANANVSMPGDSAPRGARNAPRVGTRLPKDAESGNGRGIAIGGAVALAAAAAGWFFLRGGF